MIFLLSVKYFSTDCSSKHKHKNPYRVTFHRNLSKFLGFWSNETLKDESFSFSLHIESLSWLPFWNKEYHRAIKSVFSPLKEYVDLKLFLNMLSSFIVPFLNISFYSKSTRAICLWFGKFGIFVGKISS